MSVPQWKPKLDIRDRALTLPELKALPSVIFFAECILSDTRQTISLPSAKLKTLGKDSDTRQTLCLPSALLKKYLANILTLGNSTEKHSANSSTRQKWEKHSANYGTRQTSCHMSLHCPFAECPSGNTRQTIYLFFLISPWNFFLLNKQHSIIHVKI